MYVWRRKKKVVEQLNALVRANAAKAPAQPQRLANQATLTRTATPQPVRQFQAQPTAGGGGSISEMLKRVQQRGQTVAGTTATPVGMPSAQPMPIDQARLTAFWAEYIKQLPETDAQTRSQMEAEPIANGNEVRVMVQTQMQAHDLQTNAALIGYLKQNLGNAMLTIKAEVDPAMAKNVRVVYTVEQKLEYFSEKNEVFQEFIKKFNLEAEF